MKSLIKLIILGMVIVFFYNKYIAEDNEIIDRQILKVKELGFNILQEINELMDENSSIQGEISESDAEVNSEVTWMSAHEYNSSGDESAGQQNEFISEDETVLNAQQSRNDPVTEPSAVSDFTADEKYSSHFSHAMSDEEWIIYAIKEFSPGSWDLLMQYDRLPAKGTAPTVNAGIMSSSKPATTFHFLEGRKKEDLLSSMETNVHEINHAYTLQAVFYFAGKNNEKLDWNRVYESYYVSSTEYYNVSFPSDKLFPSKDLKEDIPPYLRTFRFDTYIDGNTSTQREGILGLLNEFNAYRTGSKYMFDMLEAYKICESSRENGFFEWVANTQSTMTAFFEFDYYIKKYLLRMKEHYPENYRSLMECETFISAYKSIRKNYADLVKKYEQKVLKEIEEINAKSPGRTGITNGELWKVERSGFKSKTIVFSDAKGLLENEINPY